MTAAPQTPRSPTPTTGRVRVRGAREHNLKNVDVDIPRDALVVFTGVSGSGKSSLAFGTLYAEAQRRYLESVSPYARRLFHQMPVPEVDEIDGLPPAVALQQQRGTPTTRSSVGSVTHAVQPAAHAVLARRRLSARPAAAVRGGVLAQHARRRLPALLRPGPRLRRHRASMVPDDTLTIRERAIAAWPPAWHGQNLRDILVTLGYDVDTPWRELPKKDRDWILFTDETARPCRCMPASRPTETQARPEAQGDAQLPGHLHRRAPLRAAHLRQHPERDDEEARGAVHGEHRVPAVPRQAPAPGSAVGHLRRPRHRRAVAPAARTAGARCCSPSPKGDGAEPARRAPRSTREQRSSRSASPPTCARAWTCCWTLGLGYLALERSTPTLSPGELQRLRLATQVRSNLFGVVYVLDEPSAGLHPADTEALLAALDAAEGAGNSLFVVEHELDVIRHADWIVDVGPQAGERGGESSTAARPRACKQVEALAHAALPVRRRAPRRRTRPREPTGWLQLEGVTRNNLHELEVAFPLGVLTA